MSRVLRGAVPILFAGSAMAFAMSAYVFAPWNVVPVSLPVPMNGDPVKMPFMLATSGDFVVRLSVPTSASSPESAASISTGLPCLLFQTNPEDEGAEPIRLGEFKSAGLFVYGGIAYFDSAEKIHLSLGEQAVALRACAPSSGNQVFAELQRAGEPMTPFVLAWLVRGAAWLLFGVGTLSSIACLLRRPTARNAV